MLVQIDPDIHEAAKLALVVSSPRSRARTLKGLINDWLRSSAPARRALERRKVIKQEQDAA